jgi:hypothetical protein
VTAFYVCGSVLAAWAVVLALLGVTRENFPTTGGAERAVGLISAVLVLLAIGTAIYGGITEEEEEEHEEGGEQSALVLPA